MKELLADLEERHENLKQRHNALVEKWNEYIFQDSFIAEVLSDAYLKIELEITKTARAIQLLKESKEERKGA